MKQLRKRASEKSRTSRVSGKMLEEPYYKKMLTIELFFVVSILSIESYGMEVEAMMSKSWICRRGDLYLADLGAPIGSQQGGVRPVVVLQNNVGNYHAPTLTIAPLTSRMKKAGQPTHYTLRKVGGLQKESTVLAEQVMTIDKRCLVRYLGRVASKEMRGIDDAIRVQLGFYIPERAERRYRYQDGKMVRNEPKHKHDGGVVRNEV